MLASTIPLLFFLAPFAFGFWGWQYWFLRPLVLYTSILPWLLLYLALVMLFPWLLLTQSIRKRIRPPLENLFGIYILPAYARIMHGYEIIGLENLPSKDEGVLIVYYHGPVPWDAFFAGVAIWNYCGRRLRPAVHRAFFKVPLFRVMAKEGEATSDDRDQMIEDLKNGSTICVAPGGMYETMFSENYSVEFRGRYGFAAAAKEANVPIIPMFTENVREYNQVHFFGFRSLMKWLHETYKFEFYWAFGGLPVKLRTHLGEKMYCKENETAPEFALRVKKAIEDLRDAHQKKDGSVIRALLERFPAANSRCS